MFAARHTLYSQRLRPSLLALGATALLFSCVPEKEEEGSATATSTSTSTSTATTTSSTTATTTSSSTSTSTFVESLPGRVCTVDRFQQGSGEERIRKVDILFVMDHSGSMQDDWERVANNMQNLVRELPADTDARYAVLLADVGNWRGKLYAPTGYAKVLDSQKLTVEQLSKNLHKTFVEAMKISDSGSGEASFHSLHHAATTEAVANQKLGFFRPDAALSIIFMSDEHEIGSAFPAKKELQAAGLPVRCDESFEEDVRKDYYTKKGIGLDSAFNAVKALKGDMPVKTHAFVNITKEDLFKRNSKNSSCLYDSLGYGYFEMVAKTKGVLFSIQENKADGLARCGQAIKESLVLQREFALSKPADKVDAGTILASVDGALAAHEYRVASNSVYLEDAGKALSEIRIRHCEPVAAVKWNLTAFSGAPAQRSVALNWKTAELATRGRVAYGTSAASLSHEAEGAAGAVTDHLVNVTGLSPNTVYHFQAISEDDKGEEKRSEVQSYRTLPDWAIGGLSGQTARTSATIAWSTLDYPTKGKVLYGLSAAALTGESALSAVAVSHQASVSGLLPDTVYHFQVVASDEFGLEKRSEVIALRTQMDWGITGFTGTASRTAAALSWSTAGQDTSGRLLFGPTPALGFTALSAATGQGHSVTVTGLAPDTDYYFQAVSVDGLGAEKRSNVILIRTAVDWSITNFAGTSTQTTVALSWATPGYVTSGRVLWGSSELTLSNQAVSGAQGSSHALTVAGLTPDTLYYFQPVSVDSEGVEKRGAVTAIRTQPIPLPVWSISGLNGAATENSVTIGWSTTGYATSGKVLWGSSLDSVAAEVAGVGVVTSHSVTVTGLAADTLYYFAAVSADDRGQQRVSDVIAVRTLPATPPPAEEEEEEPAPPANWQLIGFDGTTTASQANLIWQTPGAATKAVIKVGLSPDSLTHMSLAVNTYAETHVVGVNGLNPNTTYYFQVVATDSAGRTQESVVITKRTKAQ